MLVLSRHKGERIVIGNDIVLTVVEIRGDRVRLGFTGPQEVPIHREEVFQRVIQEQNGQQQDSAHTLQATQRS
jgi:carbon storage regulator